ncbi:DUF4426 domain-containing protein [Oleiagrimonas sp. C23AA]|uniref:DUF4426 domain-containing protein n=1 Tax=Oleiagrimonas sp. C23AA TaxID=2719047 RepID=UPI0014206207|nr:DUF4426 domain-containing protein [Oleiagrimonas sp. C23AA]NII12001.1 DUF4426 domain-containing protein [Oleiagrimonas sp. C23AA]
MYARLALLAVALCSAPALAQTAAPGQVHAGDYTLRYNALSATALPATAVRALHLPRSASQGLVNVIVTRGEGPDAPTVPASVEGHAVTLTGTDVPIRFRTVKDDNGISYLGTFKVPGTDTLRFSLAVTDPAGVTTHVQFNHDYITGNGSP